MPTASLVATVEKELPDVAIIWLVTIEADATTIRLARNYEPVTSRSNTYYPYPHMEVGLANDTEDAPPRNAIVLEDIGREVVAALRELDPSSPPIITIECITEDDPDTVSDSWQGEIREASYDAATIEAEVRVEQLQEVGAPRITRTPSTHPAMFAGV